MRRNLSPRQELAEAWARYGELKAALEEAKREVERWTWYCQAVERADERRSAS